MGKNNPLKIINSLNLLDWNSLYFGLIKGYIEISMINDYASDLLGLNNYKEKDEYTLSLLASVSDKEEALSLISHLFTAKYSEDLEKEKWRLAFLKDLDQKNISEIEKIQKLQKLYEDFDYPEDMISCSLYAQDKKDPIIEMREVIKKLENYFHGKSSLDS